MKQIVLITDGCSNVGMEPAAAAALAREAGIVVNVIGVVDEGKLGELGSAEIAAIAAAGGGISRIVQPRMLSQTVRMVTQQTVSMTVRQAVNRELQQIAGIADLRQLPPEERGAVVEKIDELTDGTPLKVLLLVDASASMRNKIAAVQEAARDLMASLKARSGPSELAVLHFPGNRGEEVEIDVWWTSELENTARMFYNINMKGTTPTGPAILRAIRLFDPDAEHVQEPEGSGGLWSDYVV